MRKLATVRTVAEIRPIEGADMIVLAVVDGWKCVVKKDEFKPGDSAVYFEIDSFQRHRTRRSCLGFRFRARSDFIQNDF